MTMKKIVIAAILLFTAVLAFAQTGNGDKLIGTYLSEEGTGKIEVTKQHGKYVGTLIWTSYTDGKDVRNKDTKLRDRSLVGIKILKDMVYNDGVWKNGTIYDPESGNTYKAAIRMTPDGNLVLRGYIGVPTLGRSSTWQRVK